MQEIINNFIKQFDFEAFLENKNNLKLTSKYLIVGMGGSHLTADFFNFVFPDEDIIVYKDYSLPYLKDLRERTIITVSVSGETEEIISVLKESLAQGLNLAIISQGGQLLKLAQEKNLPYIRLPNDEIPSRLSLGYIFKSLLAIIKPDFSLKADYFFNKINFGDLKNKAQVLAEGIANKNLLVYSDNISFSLAYYWKISFNENAKKAAFFNLLPEMLHNEIEMFEDSNILNNFYALFIVNTGFIHQNIIKRIEALRKILDNLNVSNSIIEFNDSDKLVIIVKNIILASLASYFNALLRGFDPEQINLIRQIKNS